MKVAVLLLAFLPLSVMAEECSISGRAILWAYDSSFWKYETDDSIHPGVIECVEVLQNEIRGLGEYNSRLLFEPRICDIAKELNMEEPNPNPAKCMEDDQALVASVRNGGIWMLNNPSFIRALRYR